MEVRTPHPKKWVKTKVGTERAFKTGVRRRTIARAEIARYDTPWRHIRAIKMAREVGVTGSGKENSNPGGDKLVDMSFRERKKNI
jgi:hypothetical protein